MPFDVQASAAYQSLPGTQIAANYTVTSAIAGLTLTNGSITTNLVEPGTLFTERLNQVDLRLAKRFQLGRVRLDGNVEVFNILNVSPVRGVNNTFGPRWQQATSTAGGRVVKLGTKVEF